jgi:class 3 adenylate cyclase
VTFLFTDIEGSTRRWEAAADAMRVALAAHDEVLRQAIEAHEGLTTAAMATYAYDQIDQARTTLEHSG